MTQCLTLLSEVDDIEYEIEFSVYFNHSHITHVKLDTIYKIVRYHSDDTKWIKLDLAMLDKAIKAKLMDHAMDMAKSVFLQEPERKYFTEQDAECY